MNFTNYKLSKGEQLQLVMCYNWQLRFNQYTENSALAVTFGNTLFKTREILDKIITDKVAKDLLIKFKED